jgi:cold shock CspA family protein
MRELVRISERLLKMDSTSNRFGKVLCGSITAVLTATGGGFVLTESGDELYFHESMLDGASFDKLKRGDWMEFELFDSDPKRPIHVIRRIWLADSPHSSPVRRSGGGLTNVFCS